MPGPVVQNLLDTRTSKGSINKATISSLVATLQKEVRPEKLYQALTKMNIDLNAVYETLFSGPLPGIDGFELTRLNAAVLEGIIPVEYRLAYKDELNDFSRGQLIVDDDDEEPFLQMGFGDLRADPPVDPGSYFRIGALTDEEFYIAQNMFWDGAGWDFDSGVGAIRLDFIDGEISAWWYDAALADLRKTFHLVGKELFVEDDAQGGDISIYRVDEYDIVRFGDSAATDNTPYGWPSIPNTDVGNVPTASASPPTNGIIGIDATNFRLIFYTNNARYYVQGIAF